MKKISLLLLLLLPLLLGQTIVYVNSAVVTWDPVSTLSDGTPVPIQQISYEVVIARPGDKASFTILGETASMPYTVSVPQEGRWLVGVRTVRTVDQARQFSGFLWSDETTDPFILAYYKGPAAPLNLRVE